METFDALCQQERVVALQAGNIRWSRVLDDMIPPPAAAEASEGTGLVMPVFRMLVHGNEALWYDTMMLDSQLLNQ